MVEFEEMTVNDVTGVAKLYNELVVLLARDKKNKSGKATAIYLFLI
jgi:hypothetical protein